MAVIQLSSTRPGEVVPETPTLSFLGTVLRVGASPALSDDEPTAVVRVDEMISAPTLLGDLTGSIVTTLVPASPTVEPGESYVFETVGASYGKDLVVRAVTIGQAGDRDRSTALAADPRLVDDTRTADVIVLGEMVRLDEARPGDRLTEHDAALARAHVRVIETLKGSAARSIDVDIPTSADVLWQQTTSPRLGDQAIFFLRGRGKETSDSEFEVVNIRPAGAVERIRSVAAEL
jgi:hypothetical protein